MELPQKHISAKLIAILVRRWSHTFVHSYMIASTIFIYIEAMKRNAASQPTLHKYIYKQPRSKYLSTRHQSPISKNVLDFL